MSKTASILRFIKKGNEQVNECLFVVQICHDLNCSEYASDHLTVNISLFQGFGWLLIFYFIFVKLLHTMHLLYYQDNTRERPPPGGRSSRGFGVITRFVQKGTFKNTNGHRIVHLTSTFHVFFSCFYIADHLYRVITVR